MIESHNRIFIYLSSCLDESSREFQVDTWFQLSDSTWILELNISTWLEYSSQEFWLELSFDELSTQLELKYLTWRDQSTWWWQAVETSMSQHDKWWKSRRDKSITLHAWLTTQKTWCLNRYKNIKSENAKDF